ncbi:MAG: sulfotransferase [Chloroflexi bacterium]|nr:sulfotransferase [Chloroflexota bacterium]
MVAGTLANAGYFMGYDLLPPRTSNPKGYFESREINAANESILAEVTPNKPWLLGKWFFSNHFGPTQRWLARVPLETEIPSTPAIMDHIQQLVQREPYCFKDPRFSYTLSVWRPFLRNAVFICVFRDPASTAISILRECQERYLRSIYMDFDRALEVWTLMYRHVLEIHRHEGEWLFIHYNQVLEQEGLKRIERLVGTQVDRSFPDPALRRSFSNQPVPTETWQIYEHLCSLGENDP